MRTEHSAQSWWSPDQTSVEFLTGHDQQELQSESFPELDQATTDRFDGP